MGACRCDVLADDVHCLDLAGCCSIDHGGNGQAVLTGDCADIGCTLGIGLATEEVDTRAGLADVSGDKLEVCKGPYKVP